MSTTTAAQAALSLLDMPPPEMVDPTAALPKLQPKQKSAAESDATVLIYGGGAGGGKTFFELWLAAAFHHVRKYRALILRRKQSQLTEGGAIWDESLQMYSPLGSIPVSTPKHRHTFPSGATITLGGCEHEKDVKNYDGAQYSVIAFDQLEQFTAYQFFYIGFSRLRSMAGVPARVICTANPVHQDDKVGGWLARLIMSKNGWVCPESGFPIPDMSGVIRWFYRGEDDEVHLFKSIEEAREAFPKKKNDPISITFIPALIQDNMVLLEKNPQYEAGLNELPWIERQRLLGGNWKVSGKGGGIIKSEWFRRMPYNPAKPAEAVSEDMEFWSPVPGGPSLVRAWDLAGSADKGDRTASVKMGYSSQMELFIITDAFAGQWSTGEVLARILATVIEDGPRVVQVIPIDPAQAGKYQARDLRARIDRACRDAHMEPPTVRFVGTSGKSKYERSEPFRRAVEPSLVGSDGVPEIYGRVAIVEGQNTDDCLNEFHQYDATTNCRDDYLDAASDAYDVALQIASAVPAGQVY